MFGGGCHLRVVKITTSTNRATPDSFSQCPLGIPILSVTSDGLGVGWPRGPPHPTTSGCSLSLCAVPDRTNASALGRGQVVRTRDRPQENPMDTYHRQAIALLAGAECAACPKDVSSHDLMQRVDIKFGLAVGTTKIEFTKSRSDLGVYLRASGSSTWPEGVHRLLCESHAVKIVPVSATELADKEPVRNSLRCQFCGRREHRCDYIVHAVGGTGKFNGPSWLGAATVDDLKCEVCAFDEADQEKYLGAFAIGETCLQRLVHHHGVSTLLLKLIWRAQNGDCGHGDTVDEDMVEQVANLLEAMHTTHHDAKKLTPIIDELEFGDEFWGSVFRHVTKAHLSADFLIDAGELGRRNLAGEWEVYDSEDEEEDDEEEEEENQEYDWSDEPSAASKLGKRRRVVESDDEDDDLPSPPQRRVTRASSMSTSAARPPSKKKTKECHAIVLDDDEMDEADGQGGDSEEPDEPEEAAAATEDEKEEDAPSEPVGEAAEEASPPPPRRSRELLADLLEVIAQSELDGERLDLLRLATEFQRLLFFKNNLQIPSPGSSHAIEASKAVTMGHELVASLSRRGGREVHVEVLGDVVSRMSSMLA